MADTDIFAADMVPRKVRSAKALKPTNASANVADQILPAVEVSAGKENHHSLSKPKKKSSKSKKQGTQSDLTEHQSNNNLTSDRTLPVPEVPAGKENTVPKKKTKSKKQGKKSDTSTTTESGVLTALSDPTEELAGKEKMENLSQPTKKNKGASKQQPVTKSFEQEMQEMQEKLEKLRIEKEETEGILKEREEALKLKEEELENRGREQQKLQLELKKLQKLKEFKPSMTFPIVQSLREKDQEKKKKSGSETKRPSPPYVLWVKDQWNEVKKMNPEAEFKEMSVILGAKWKTVSAEEKKPYEEKYQTEKEEYLKIIGNEKRENEAMRLLEEEHKQRTAMELLEQYLQFKQESEKDNKKPKKEKDPSKPKHPMSAFFVFMSERRALLAETMNASEVAKKAGEEWKTMSEEEKAKYEEVAKRNKEQYAAEMEVYKQKKKEETESITMEEEEMMKIQKQEALQLLKKKEKTENIIKKTKENIQKKKQNKIVDPNKPKRPPSSYLLYCKEARRNLVEERPGISNSTLNALISVKWKEMNEEEKQEWNRRAAEYMEAYKKEMEDYNVKSASASASASANQE